MMFCDFREKRDLHFVCGMIGGHWQGGVLLSIWRIYLILWNIYIYVWMLLILWGGGVLEVNILSEPDM